MRLINRPLALILAAALAAASIILIVEVVAHALHATSPLIVHWTTWYHWAGRTRWNALVITIWSIILIIAGVLVLAPQLKPRRVTRLKLRSDDNATDAAITRGGLAGALRAAVLDIDGISKAAIRVRRRRARVTATAAARDRAVAGTLRQPVTDAASRRLDDLQLRHPPRLRVRVIPRSR